VKAPVLSNETIEVHLTYMRTGLDTVQAALPVLRDKIDLVSAKVDSKMEALEQRTNARIDAVNSSLTDQIKETNGRIDALNTSLTQKIDEANKQRAAGNAALGDKIDKLAERVLGNQGHQKAVLWVFSLSSVVAALVSIARTLGWI
jgi:hypothetical protein